MITALQIEKLDHEHSNLIDQVFCLVKPDTELIEAEKNGSIFAVVADYLNSYQFWNPLSCTSRHFAAEKLFIKIKGGLPISKDLLVVDLKKIFAVIGRDVLFPILQTDNYGIDRKLDAVNSLIRAYNAQHHISKHYSREMLNAAIRGCQRISGTGWNAKAVTSRLCSLLIEATK